MRPRTLSVWLALPLGAVALGLSAGEVPGDAQPQPEERVVALLAELATQVTEAPDCDRVAAAIRAWSESHRAELPGLVTQTEARAESLPADVEARLEVALAPAMEQIFTAAVTCGEHDETVAAFESLDAIMASGREAATP